MIEKQWEANRYQPGKSQISDRYESDGMEAASQRQPDVVASLMELDIAVEELTAVFSALGNRLTPVSRIVPEGNEKNGCLTRQGACSVSSSIVEATNRLRGLARVVAKQIETLEV